MTKFKNIYKIQNSEAKFNYDNLLIFSEYNDKKSIKIKYIDKFQYSFIVTNFYINPSNTMLDEN